MQMRDRGFMSPIGERLPLMKQIEFKTADAPNGCKRWRSQYRNGIPVLGIKEINVKRTILEHSKVPQPPDKPYALAMCGNKWCISADHLAWGDAHDRIQLMRGLLTERGKSVLERIEMRTIKLGDGCGCWKHEGSDRSKYPRMTIEGKRKIVARIILEHHAGPPPSGKTKVMRSCGHSWCINPDHLSWGGRREILEAINRRKYADAGYARAE